MVSATRPGPALYEEAIDKEPRPQRLQDLDEGLGIGPEAWEFFDGR